MGNLLTLLDLSQNNINKPANMPLLMHKVFINKLSDDFLGSAEHSKSIYYHLIGRVEHFDITFYVT